MLTTVEGELNGLAAQVKGDGQLQPITLIAHLRVSKELLTFVLDTPTFASLHEPARAYHASAVDRVGRLDLETARRAAEQYDGPKMAAVAADSPVNAEPTSISGSPRKLGSPVSLPDWFS